MNHDVNINGGRLPPPVLFWFSQSSDIALAKLRFFIALAVIIFVCYSNTFHTAWQLDDKPNILANKRIQITQLTPEQIWQSMTAKPGSGGFYRPVACFTLGLNWFLGQDKVFGYHVVNFLIHLGTAWALFLVILNLFQTPHLKGRYQCHQIIPIAGIATLLWALNPVQTQAVTYIVQRMASLAAMFAVLSILFYLKARLSFARRSRLALFSTALFFYVLGVFCKENVVLLPFSVPVLEALFFMDNQSWRINKKVAAGVLIALAVCILCGVIFKTNTLDFILNYYIHRPFTMTERFLSEQRVVLFYLSLLFFPAPSRLSIEHDIVLSSSIFSPWTTAVSIFVNGLLIFLAVRNGRKQPLLSLAILFFYLNHIVESTIVPLELIFEHRNYLPSVFLFLPVAELASKMVFNKSDNKGLLIAIALLMSIIISVEGYATYTRNKVWKTEQSLWLDAMSKAPLSARPIATIAILLAWGEHQTPAKFRKALELTQRSLSLRMTRNLKAEQLGNMASIYEKLGQIDKAYANYQQALSISPDQSNNRYNFAKLLISQGDFKRAQSELEFIINKGGIHADYYYLLGFIDLWLSEPEHALIRFQDALKLSPMRPDILLGIGNCLSAMGYFERSQWFLRLAERAGGNDVIVSLNLIQNTLRRGETASARKFFNEMISMFPVTEIWRLFNDDSKRYRIAPLDRPLLASYISSEMKNLVITDENGFRR